jgi:hypothetical protein
MIYYANIVRFRKADETGSHIGVFLMQGPSGQLSQRAWPEGSFQSFQNGDALLDKIIDPTNKEMAIEVLFKKAINDAEESPVGVPVPAGKDLSIGQLTRWGFPAKGLIHVWSLLSPI